MALSQPLSEIFQRGAITGWNDISATFGDTFHDLDGNPFQRGEKIRMRRGRGPVIISPQKAALGDLIPGTSFGASLANLLTKTNWDRLREPLIEANHHVCELCAQKYGTMDVHEIWEYDFPSDDEQVRAAKMGMAAVGTQRLTGFVTVCSACHKCFHLGFANVQGNLADVLDRLAGINNWSEIQAKNYCRTVFRRWQHASKFQWFLDLGIIGPQGAIPHPLGGMIIKSGWTANEEDAGKTLTARNQQSITALLNVPWRFVKETEWRPVLTPADFQ